MTDNAPDTGGKEQTGAPESDAVPAATTAGAGGGDELVIRIVEPDGPGTIFVAVADPPEMLHGQAPPCPGAEGESGPVLPESDAEPAEQTGEDFMLPAYGDLAEVVAVRLGGFGPALFFLANGVECARGDAVIVEMEEGQAYGIVANAMRMDPQRLVSGLGEGAESGKIRPVLRKATDKDVATAESNRNLAGEALEYCRDCIRERNLDMKLVDVLILHDRGKMVFYFTAPARIDFRELVKDLVRRYRTRIELRQIGVRHETQMVGALGNCGMVCCCRRYLRKFAPVAIKMAKEQNVFLNPVKISGICGRLLCCLAYEQEHYDEFYRSCPKLGKKYHTDAGIVRVLRASLFRESVTVLSDTGEEAEYSLSDWSELHPFRPNAGQQQSQSGKRQDQGDRPRKDGRNSLPSRQDRPEKAIFAEDAPGTAMPDAENSLRAAEKPPFAAYTPFARASAGDKDAEEYSGQNSDDGGSIFGLNPRGTEHPSDAPAREYSGANSADNTARSRRPYRRGRGRRPQSDS